MGGEGQKSGAKHTKMSDIKQITDKLTFLLAIQLFGQSTASLVKTFDIAKDTDTDRLLAIAIYFLTRYFGYSVNDAIDQARLCYTEHPTSWGDDFYHHEGAFRTAAWMHYHRSTAAVIPRPHFVTWLRLQSLEEQQRDAAIEAKTLNDSNSPEWVFAPFDGHHPILHSSDS